MASVVAACSTEPAATQDSGAAGDAAAIELRNVTVAAQLIGVTPDDPSSAYGEAALSFTAVNTADIGIDRLLDISSPAAASVTLGATDEQRVIEPGTSIAAGQPVENIDSGADGTDQPFSVTLDLIDGELAPGTSIPVTFEFEGAGELSVDAPFDVFEPGELTDTRRPLPPVITPTP
ncbi:hypothetical protein [Rhodococcus sp. IEGM 1343]|uniref:hypothetical protein n=1 Tax=Rhodococcus sp. IEGM 1343 TaxID=3082224 RepID=UPI0029538028|nr:hypothetical protein [Rhodococcus sp. IEGM 1343]MDV8056442.1 hypothetical protein [Rhodococcus sp. IEGM 1343]